MLGQESLDTATPKEEYIERRVYRKKRTGAPKNIPQKWVFNVRDNKDGHSTSIARVLIEDDALYIVNALNKMEA